MRGQGEHVWRPNRREFLFAGLVAQPRVDDGGYFQAASAIGGARRCRPKAKAVINIYLPGGMASQESFDPKLLVPIEYRGPLGTVKTKLDGVYFSEPLKRTAEIADKICVVRSMTHGEAGPRARHA